MNSGIKIGRGITPSDHTMQVQIGDVCCSVMCRDATILRGLNQLFAGFLSDKPADINIELDVVDRFTASSTESALPQTKMFKWGERIGAICRASGDTSASASPAIKVTLEREQLTPRFSFKIMNLLMPSFYYTGLWKQYRDNLPAMLVHACGIIRRGKLMIFTGPSETGKTTIARLCGSEHGQVVNDEMLLVTGAATEGAALMTQGVPIIGGVAQRLNTKAPLACVLMLKQAQKTSVHPLERSEAYRRFLRQVIMPRELVQPDDNTAMLTEVARFSDMMTRAVPFYELEFTLEKEPLWRAVGEIEESYMKGRVAR